MARRQLRWFMLGFAAATAVGVLFSPRVAHAQDNGVFRGTQPMRPLFPEVSSVPSRGRPPEPLPDDSYAAPGIPEPVPEDDPSRVPEEQDGLEPTPRAGQRPVVLDGDPNYPAEPVPLRDGIVDSGEPPAPEDGTDPSTVDTRPAEDVAAFENPPAGYDPLLFQIEDLDPVRDNRLVTRLFKREPFDPVGIKAGSFVLFPELELAGNYYDNVFHAPKGVSDQSVEARPSARLVSDWSRHALEIRAASGLSYYNSFDTENEQSYIVEARGRLDITRRTNIEALISREQYQESRSAIDVTSAGTRPTVTGDRIETTFNQRFNRLAIQIRGSVNDYTYGDATVGSITQSNKDRAYTAYEETTRFSWEFKPVLFAFAEVAVNMRDYGMAAQSDLISRDSTGERYRMGLAFGNTGKILRGEIALGYGVQTPDDSRLRKVDGLIIDANATWRITELTSLLFTAHTDVAETTTANEGGALYRYMSIEARHSLQRYLIGTIGLAYATNVSPDGVIDESELRTTAGLEYYLNREAVLFGRYAHISSTSVSPNSDFEADEVRLGMRLRR
jgi:hypothetical protein